MSHESPHLNPQARGREIRQARVRRTRSIRRRVVAGAATLFSAAWLGITVLLVSGHDPALSKTSKTTTAAAVTATATTTATTPATTTATTPATTTPTSSSNTTSPSAVTTSQS